MSFFNNLMPKEIKKTDFLSAELKFAYLVKKFYRFSESELKLNFGKDYESFITDILLKKSPTDQYYYCNPKFLKTLGNGNIDSAIFYSSLTLEQLKLIIPKKFHQGNKNDIVTTIVRDHYRIFPKIENIDDKIIKDLILAQSDFKNIKSQYDNYSNSSFEFSAPHRFYLRPVYSIDPEVVYEDITDKHKNLFTSGYIHCLVNKHPISCCVILNPNVCAKILETVKSKVKAKKKELLENIPEIKVNPSDIEYHENKLNLFRIIAFFLAALDNEEITLTNDFTFRVTELKTFWKNIFQESLADNQIRNYENILGTIYNGTTKEKYQKLTLKERISYVNDLNKKVPNQYKEAILNFPKDKWIPIDNLLKTIPCSEIITKEYTAICDVEEYLNISSGQDYHEDITQYLLARRIFDGDVDLEIALRKNEKKKYEKIIKSFRIIQNSTQTEILEENPNSKIYIENNLTLSLPPDLPLDILLRLLKIFSPKGLNILELDKNSIFRLKKQSMTFKMACDHIESILGQTLPKSALDFLQKELPNELSTITLYPYNRLITLTNPKDLPKVIDAVGNDKHKVIDDKFIILKPWTTLGSLKSKFKNRKIILEVDDLREK